MSVHRQAVNVASQAAYPTNPQVVIPFEPTEISLHNEDSQDDAYISFDGTTDHLHLTSATAHTFSQRVKRMWLRRGDVNNGSPTTIQVVAEN